MMLFRLILVVLIAFPLINKTAYATTLLPIGSKTYTFNDPARDKKIALMVWYPTTTTEPTVTPKGIWQQDKVALNTPINTTLSTGHAGKLPLIMLSHGYQGSPESLSWFAVTLARQGFIVAAPQHQDTGPNTNPYMEHWQRALDISFILKELKKSSLQHAIDFDRVGMAGYSVGTSTGLWLAGGIASTYEQSASPGRQFVPEGEFPEADSEEVKYLLEHTDFKTAKKSYRDPLIKSVFLMAPGYGWAFDAKHLGEITIPVFLVAAENDEMLYPATNAYYFSKYIPHSAMRIMPDVGHFVFLNAKKDSANPDLTPEEKKRLQFVGALGKFHYSEKERQAVHQQVGELAVDFFSATLNSAIHSASE